MKARDVQAYPIAIDTTALRSRTWDRLKFEIEYALQKGTTANSYLISADKTALFDPPGESFTEIFLKELQQRLDPKTLDYIILGHVNPNRGETLKALLKIAPQITFICSNPAAISLREILETPDLNIQVIKSDETLDLGGGHNLEFILTPNPRYPDQLCTYDPKTQILYSDKLFGAHVCGDQIFDEGWQIYLEDRRYYFDCVMAPHAKKIANAVEKVTVKPAQIYATGHGPLVRYGLSQLIAAYQQWAQDQQKKELSVAVVYASAYGNTAVIANAIARGITKAGVAVESINAEIADPEEVKAIIEKCAGVIVGSPTLGGHAPTQIQTALGVILASADKTKLAGAFGSFGWSGEAIDLIESKFRDAGYRLGFDTIRVNFKPDAATLQYCEEAGIDFAQALKKAKKTRTPKPPKGSQADRTAQAVGRIVGSLCVVTSQQEEVSGAMLASWVSQATFNPPGLTVAVAKDRAIESLLHNGNPFVLNILPEGKANPIMKQFLKPFGPGEDRFAGIEMEKAENGAPVLKDALAYLECRVDNRMECGDHWLIYAIAQTGKVLESDGVTAVHHRKTGTYY